jgi:hypothetical protein
MRLRVAVQKQQRRSAAAESDAQHRLAHVDLLQDEAGEQIVGHAVHSL